MQQNNVTIVGGGPVGCATAIMLAKYGKNITLLDKVGTKSMHGQNLQDGRVLALSYASISFLEELGVELSTLGTSINAVHVSHTGLGINCINAKDINLKQLGFTVKYNDIIDKLYTTLSNYSNIVLQNAKVTKVIPNFNSSTIYYTNLDNGADETINSQLVVLAEGGNINLDGVLYKEYDYNKYAVISQITVKSFHNNIAYERFEQDGPLVLLPHGDGYTLVWALDKNLSENINEYELHDKLANLPFMQRFGAFKVNELVYKYPLKLKIAKNRVICDSVVLVGNSSQIVHPVSAQGLNLGLRDVRDLCELLVYKNNVTEALVEYSKIRNKDVLFVTGFTHFLAKFLELQNPLIKHIRGLGILTLGNFKFLQNKLSKSLVFGV